jgi:hypothetical protein
MSSFLKKLIVQDMSLQVTPVLFPQDTLDGVNMTSYLPSLTSYTYSLETSGAGLPRCGNEQTHPYQMLSMRVSIPAMSPGITKELVTTASRVHPSATS